MSVLIGGPNGRLAFMLNSLSSYNIEIIIHMNSNMSFLYIHTRQQLPLMNLF